MSRIYDETSSDEDESYQNMTKHKMGYSIEDASVIDDSNNETSIDTSADHDKSNNISIRSPRESGIFPVRKKPVRVLDSEDDKDSDNDELDNLSLAHASIKSLEEEATNDTTTDISNDSTDDSYESESVLKVKQKALPVQLSDSEEETMKTPIPKKKTLPVQNYSTSESDEETVETQIPNTKSSHSNRINSSSGRRLSKSGRASVGAEISQEKNVSATPHVDLEHINGDASLSTKIRNARLSQNFQYNSTGILNSTAIDSAHQNTNWRLSNNFNDIREVKEVSDHSVEIVSDHDSDIIEVSSDERTPSPKKTPFKLPRIKNAARQQTLHSFILKTEALTPLHKKPLLVSQQPKPLVEIQPTNQQDIQPQKIIVSRTEYESQWSRVNNFEIDYVKLQNMLENINYEALPDKGQLIKERVRIAENRYKEEKNKFDKMEVSDTKVDQAPKGAFANVAWEDIEAGANGVLPKTFGKTAMSTYNAQKAVTLDRLQQLHEAMQTCPKEDDFEDDPKGIKVPLMPHQKRALAWILFREKEKPAGGILADDMGLGKTLTMLSLIVKSLQLEKSANSDEENKYVGKNTKYNGGSLIVCPASLINQWSGEIDRRLKRGLVSYVLYHGPKRETRAKALAEYDIVITTYAIINNEAERHSAAFKIKWRRVILDEAHTIRNYKAQTSVACCQLSAKSRWALTGTPMHNKELDMYALLKFLRCSPFDDLQVWKRWVGDKSSGGVERLHTVISSLMLRRTKVELMEKGALNCMPEKKWELVKVELDKNEMRVYHKVMIFSQTLFAQFLHQRAEKNQDYIDHKLPDAPNNAPNQEYHKMRQKLLKLNKVKDVSQHEILVLLLRLRQICCHPSLITAMLDESRDDIGVGDEECEQLNLLDQLEKLNIEDEDEYQPEVNLSAVAEGISQDVRITLKEASKGHLHPSDPVFAKTRASSKIKAMLKVLRDKVIVKDEKAIIVSQWSSYLKLVAMHLKDYDIEFDQLDGQVPVNKRMAMVDRLNNPRDSLKVLLLSLTAGGVGLNLVGANHLFLLDLHWNPQLENQAQDRIYRVGQTKPVFVYKFMATDTIEERIKALQDKKLAMAEGLLTGTKQATQSKLSLQDLRMIFGM